MKKTFNIFWRIFVIVLAVFLLRRVIKGTEANLLSDLAASCKPLLLEAFLLYGLVQIFNTMRWQLLLMAQGLKLGFADAFRLVLCGGLFNCVLPGAVTGDIIKIALTSRNFPGKKTEITLTIFLDRLIGMFGMFIAATLVTVLGASALQGAFQTFPALKIAVCLANLATFGVGIIALLFLFKPFLQSTRLCRLLMNAASHCLPRFVAALFQRLDAALEMYREHKSYLLGHLAYSTLIHLTCGLAFFCIGRALHETALSALQYNLTMQIANFCGALPITPAGLGLRESVSASLFNCFGISPAEVAGSIPIIYSSTMFAWALIGAFALSSLPSDIKQSAFTQEDAK